MKVLGLDIGITSCGWALVDEDRHQIIGAGVRIFDKAEQPKTGASLNQPRRVARSARRRLRRRHQRLQKLRLLLVKVGIIDKQFRIKSRPDIWALRIDALDRSVSGDELATVLHSIAKRRGFRSTRKKPLPASNPEGEEKVLTSEAGKGDADATKMKAGAFTLETKLRCSGKRTIGEYLATLEPEPAPAQQVFQAHHRIIRNKKDLYSHTVLRSLLEEEVSLILRTQRDFGSISISDEDVRRILDIMFSQLPVSSVIEMVGECEFIPGEKRAPRHSVTFERSRCLQKLANLREFDKERGEPVVITPQIRDAALKHLEVKGTLNYADIAALVGLDSSHEFRDVNYKKYSATRKKDEAKTTLSKQAVNKKEAFIKAPFLSAIRKALVGYKSFYEKILADCVAADDIALILSSYSDEESRAEKLSEIINDPSICDLLAPLGFAGFGGLSFKALRMIEGQLLAGMDYTEAMKAVGFTHSDPNQGARERMFLPMRYASAKSLDHGITNPVVRRALHEATKVVNQITRQYGKPARVVIELARDLGRAFSERASIRTENESRAKENDGWATRALELGLPNNGESRLKMKLWNEQGCECVYCGRPISQVLITDPNSLQIDHILPYGRSFDDGHMNKVLVHTECNQFKGDQTPFEKFHNDEDRWQIIVRLGERLPYPKYKRLVQRELNDDEWKKRNLNDTRYIAREFSNFLKHCYLPRRAGEAERIEASSGRITAVLRRLWGLSAKDRNTHLHHATDAILTAVVTPAIIKRITEHFKRVSSARSSTDRRELRLSYPWEGFRDDVDACVKSIFVSYKATRKYTGEAHAATILSRRLVGISENGGNDYAVYKRVRLSDLDPKQIEKLIDKDGRNWKLYEALKARVEEYKHKPKETFREPFYIPGRKPGMLGAEVKSILIEDDSKSGIQVRGKGKNREGFANNGEMIRIDLFRKKGRRGQYEYYMIPVYVHQLAGRGLPNRVVKGGVPENEWPELDETYQFMFSVYPGEYLELVESDSSILEGYFVTADRAGGKVTVRRHDRGDSKERKGIKSLQLIRKFKVDVLGNKREIHPGEETRYGLANGAGRKRSETKGRKKSTGSGAGGWYGASPD